IQPYRDQIRQRLTRSWPINTGLRSSTWRNPHGAHAASTPQWREPRHRSNQWLANGDHIRLCKKPPEAFPVLFVGKRVEVGSHRLVHIHSQGSVKLFGYSRDLRQARVVRLHHDGDNGYGHAQSHTTFRLLVDQGPIAGSALCILLGFGRVIERELDVMKDAQFVVLQNCDAVAVGSDGQFDGLRSQVTQYRFELWMHAVLAGAEIHRTDRQSFHDRFHLIQREAIGAGWIPVTKGA